MTPELIQVIDVLTDNEVQTVRDLIEQSAEYEGSTIFGRDSGELVVANEIRSNSRYCLPEEHTAAELLHTKVNDALLEYKRCITEVSENWNSYPVPGGVGNSCWREQFQVLKYEKGESYKTHFDTSAHPDVQAYHRSISVVLYLQNAVDGGRTIFPHRKFKPKPGQALIFPSNWCFPHSAEEVYEGTKISVVTWYHSNVS